jgi:hypothetical protein
LVLLGVASPALADDRAREAEAHFRRGRDAAKRGDHVTACTELAESQRLDPAPGTLLNLGDCEEKQGHYTRAWQYFADARTTLAKDDDRATIADKRATEIAQRIARVTFVLAKDAPTGTHAERGGESPPIGREIPLEAGTFSFDVVAPGRPKKTMRLDLRAGESRQIVLEPEAEVVRAPAPPPPQEPQPSSSSRKTFGFLLGGVGLAGIGVGVVTGVMVGAKASTYKQHCDASGCDQDGLDAASSGKTLQVVSPVALAVGVLAAGAGAYLIFTDDGTRAGVAPAPGGGAVVVGKSFR